MKKTLIVAALVLTTVAAYSQGLVNFANAGPGLNVPDYHSDGTTKLSGSQFQAELLGGASSTSLSPVSGAITPYLAGGGGFFNGGSQAIPGVTPGGTAWILVRAWNTLNGATFALAQSSGALDAFGTSNGGVPFSVVTGGAGTPAGPPATLVGLTSFSLNVPEPTTFVLGGLGVASLLLFRRRK